MPLVLVAGFSAGAAAVDAGVPADATVAALSGPPEPAVAASATAAWAVTVWLVRCPTGRFDPMRGEPDHLDRSDFATLVAAGVLAIDDQVTATGAACVHISGTRRQDLPPRTVYAAITDHVGLDLDAVVTPLDGGHAEVDVDLVRHALVKLGGADGVPSVQTSSWRRSCGTDGDALRFLGQGIRPGKDQAEAVLVGVSTIP